MNSVNTLYSNEYSKQRPFNPKSHGQDHQSNSVGGVTVSDQDINATLTQAYKAMQGAVASRLPVPGVEADSSSVGNTNTDVSDVSPQAVADRIMQFISQRLEQERAAGASDERIQDLYQQALSGVETGLREAKDIIQSYNLYDGEVKDNFMKTANLLADSLEALGESLFGASTGASVGTPEAAGAAISRVQSQSVSVAQDRHFEMEVVTQDGDRVTLLVQSGQSFSSQQMQADSQGVSVSGFESTFSQYDHLSFRVDGELDEGELSALNDLFSQVNAVADTFYGGNIEQAFDQALGVGMNVDELSAFSVDMTRVDTIAVQNTYAEIDRMNTTEQPASHAGLADVMTRLQAFADQLHSVREQVEDQPRRPENHRVLLDGLVAKLYPDAPDKAPNQKAFHRFIEQLN